MASLSEVFAALVGFLQCALDAVEIRQRQLRVDDFDVARRIDLAGDMNDVVVLEAAHHMCDGVNFTDM